MTSSSYTPKDSLVRDVRMAQDCAPRVSIVITTRNRMHELRRAIESCLAQTGDHHDVWVYDDASTDGTAQDVRTRYPEVRLVSCRQRRGLVVRRNEALCAVGGRYIISLDDDAYFTSQRTVSRVIELFDQFPRAAVIALPFVEPSRPRGEAVDAAPAIGTQLRSFIGCAHAMRRDEVLQVGGYRELLVHQGEERDLSIRLLDRGYEIVSGDTPPIVHCPSPQRDLARTDFYGYRNTLLFHWLNCPTRYLSLRMLGSTVRLLQHRFSWRRLPRRSVALLAGWLGCLTYGRLRNPVSRFTYRRFCSLPGHGPIACDVVIAPCTRDDSTQAAAATEAAAAEPPAFAAIDANSVERSADAVSL